MEGSNSKWAKRMMHAMLVLRAARLLHPTLEISAAAKSLPMALKKHDDEPEAQAELAPFDDGDFHCVSARLARDPQYNDRRLVTRRKLASIAKLAVDEIAAEVAGKGGAIELQSRTSLHQPHMFNHMRVRRIWAYITRGKKEKARLKQVLGAELAKDLDSSYRNAYLCVAVEEAAIEVSLRIHPDAWFDGQNLVHRTQKEGYALLLPFLNDLDGFRLKLDNWKGEWICGKLTSDKLAEFFRYYKPGEHGLAVEQRLPAPPGARGNALAEDVPEMLVLELRRLAPLYRLVAWSQESDHLFKPR